MLPASCKLLLLNALWLACLAGGRCAEANATAAGTCLAVVKYSAITGDPGKANKSDIFRGFVRVEDQLDQWKPRDALLSWTFTKGETIIGGDNVFRDSVEQGTEPGDVHFSSSTTANTQSVEMEFFADEEVVDIGFVASKGSGGGGSGGRDTRTSTGLPASMEYNGLVCEESDDQLDQQFQSTEDDAELSKGDSILELEYLPIEFTNMRFGTGYASNFAIFTFRLTNNGTTPIDLANVELEYWFDGGSAEGRTSDIMFNSECMTATVTDCGQFKVSVLPGLENVSGAHYKVVVGFREDAGVLTPQKSISLPINGSMGERGSPMIEAIMNITSAQFFAQIDVTKDYSFLNTTILDEEHNLPDELVSRQYELNPKMPVFMNGRIIFGNRPKSSLQKAKLSVDSNQNQCWFKKPGIQQCGMRARYCCFRPPELLGGSQKKSIEWLWISGLVLAGAFLSMLCMYLSFRRRYMRNYKRRSSMPLGQSKFGSDAGSIMMDSGGLFVKPGGIPYEEFDDSVGRRSSAKYHTVPSIVGINALLLDPNVMEWDPREEKTWTGHIHWYWEPWNEAEVRRTATALPVQNSGPGSFLTMTTKYMQKIDVHVDYKTEIEPFLKQQLGEGGFGKVYQATFRGTDVAVKVLKVDTDAMIRNLEDEIRLSSKMHNEHIVELLGACLGNKDNVCLIMELVDGGNLSTRIHNKNLRRLEYIEVLYIGLDIVRGLAYLHPTVIHRDLKPQNVLLSKDGRCKIADFGISKFKDPHKSYLSVTQTGGTPNYMAPELFNGTRVDEKCDIFSLGCILYEAMARRVPLSDLQGDNCAPLFQIIKTVAIDKRRPKIPETFPSDLAELIRACWKDNPRSRPSSNDVAKQLERMINDEVERMKELRESAQRKDSGASNSSTDRRSPVFDIFGGRYSRHEHHPPSDGRRSLDPREEASRRPKPKSKVSAQAEAKNPAAPPQRSIVELETYHSAKSLDFFSVEDHGRPEIPAHAHKLESALSNPDSIYDEVQELIHSRSGSTSSSITPRSAGSKETRKTRSKDKKGGQKEASQHVSDLSAVVEELDTNSRTLSSDRMSLCSNGISATYGQYEQEECCKSKPVARKASNSRFNDISKLEINDSFRVELVGIQRKVDTQS